MNLVIQGLDVATPDLKALAKLAGASGIEAITPTAFRLRDAKPDPAIAAHCEAAQLDQVFVPDERYIDMATAISGSGPGFVFLIIEGFIDAAVHIGFSRDIATEMVLQTVAGSARFAQETGKHPAELKNMVSSPGGTTVEGLQALEARGLRAALTEAVIATYNKSKALGGAQSSK